jgi:hypothetical protein
MASGKRPDLVEDWTALAIPERRSDDQAGWLPRGCHFELRQD